MKPLRIAVAYFFHEATTFSVEKADLSRFSPLSYKGDALLAHPEYIAGFVKAAREYESVELIPLESFGEVVGASSVGWITNEAYEHYVGLILRDLRAALPVDAVYLSLHGAAAVIGVPKPEADLARRVREIVGSEVPIAGTFDLHGNEDDTFLRYANVSLTVKYYPHYDAALQGERAARLLIRAARGEFKPISATRKPGIITSTVYQWTGQKPWNDIMQRALIWEARRPDAFVNVFFGFPWSDVPDVGATVQVITNGNAPLANQIAEDMSAYMLRRRAEMFDTEIVPPNEAVKTAASAVTAGEYPVVLADYSDRAGDSTFILREVIDQNLSGVLYATLRDEHVLDALRAANAKTGDEFDREVGGYVIPGASGEPVRVQGRLAFFGTLPAAAVGGRTDLWIAVISFGVDNWLVITPGLAQITSPEQVAWLPIDWSKVKIWVLKSRVHFRAGFDDSGFAKKVLIVDAPAPYLGTVHLESLPYRNVDLRNYYPYNEARDETMFLGSECAT